MGKLGYRPEIDGLRAISVLAVLLFHAGFGFTGGFVGVDVFFVISGFLITSLVVRDLQADKFHFIEFWERRVRRIFPALTVMVIGTLVASFFVLLPLDFEKLAKSAIAQTLLAANFHFLGNTGYFDGAADLKPLLHTWSLAVEEQFYLVFPLLLCYWRRLPLSALRIRLGVLCLISFVASAWGTYAFPAATFYLLPMRAWELMAGSLLAISLPAKTPSRLTLEVGSGAGLAVIIWTTLYYESGTPFPGLAALPPCLGAVLFILSNTNRLTFTGQLLACRPAVFIGQISYSLYLWHWPVLALMRSGINENLSVRDRLLAVALSFLLGWGSWKLVETPLRKTTRLNRRMVFSLSTVCSVLVLGISIGIISNDGFKGRLSPEICRIIDGGRMARIPEQEFVALGSPLQTGQQESFLIWGDSHARALTELIDRLAQEHEISGYAAIRSGTLPTLGTWRRNDPAAVEWNESVIAFIKEHRIKNVIMASRWMVNIDGRLNGSLKTLIVDDQSQETSQAESRRVLKRSLQRTLDELRATGVTVWILRQVPQQAGDIPRQLVKGKLGRIRPDFAKVSLLEHLAYQQAANEILNDMQSDDVHLMDPTAFCFDEQGRAKIWDSHVPFYGDDHHLSVYGAEQLMQPLIDSILSEIIETRHLGDHADVLPAADGKTIRQASGTDEDRELFIH